MTPAEEEALALHLERDIDRFGLRVVLSALADVCQAKAEHLRTNWQDEDAAKVWERSAANIERVRVHPF